MKTKFYSLLLFLFCFSNIGYSQTGIGAYSVHDGGFENHTATLAGGSTTNAALSSSLLAIPHQPILRSTDKCPHDQ